MPTPQMATQDGRVDAVEALWQAVEDCDERGLRDLCAADFHIEYSSGRRLDLDDWIEKLEDEDDVDAFANLRHEIDEVVTGDEAVAVLGREVRDHVDRFVGVDPDGEAVTLPFCGIVTFDGDAIGSLRIVEDEGRFLRDAGVIPGDGLAWKIRQLHADVLNRILRHNLRNDLNAALLRAGEVDDETLRGEIQQPIEELLDMVEKTRHIEQHVVENTVRPEWVDVRGLVRTTVDDVTDRLDTDGVTLAVEEDIRRLRTDPHVLESVLCECIENAIVHARPDAQVDVSLEPAGDGVSITVADDGPGISDYELAPIRQERETPIVHGSGVGLWAIKWGIEQLEGTVDFETNGTDGTVVRLTVPGRESSTRD